MVNMHLGLLDGIRSGKASYLGTHLVEQQVRIFQGLAVAIQQHQQPFDEQRWYLARRQADAQTEHGVTGAHTAYLIQGYVY